MRIQPYIGACLIAAAVLGCGKANPELAFPERQVLLPDTTQAGVAGGKCSFDGERPIRRKLPVQDAWCGSVGERALSEDLIVDTESGLAGVFIHVIKGLEDYTFPHVKTPAVVDQKNCTFVPHVLGVRLHQPVHFTNSDGTVHNINALGSREEQGFVFSMAPSSEKRIRQFPKRELGLAVRCDLHSAMVMYVHVVDSPYFAITGEDGRWEIPDLPEGSYTFEAIHERCGRQTFAVEVTAGGKTVADLSFQDDD